MAKKESIAAFRKLRGYKPPDKPAPAQGPDPNEIISRLDRLESYAKTQEERYKAAERARRNSDRAKRYRSIRKSADAPKRKPEKRRGLRFRKFRGKG